MPSIEKYSNTIIVLLLALALTYVYNILFWKSGPLIVDMQVHARLVQTDSFDTVPHYLVHWLAKMHAHLFRIGSYTALIDVISILSCIYFFLYIHLFKSAKGKMIAVLSILAVPVFDWWTAYDVVTGENALDAKATYRIPYLGSFPKHQWHNPTMVALLPLLIIWFIAVRSFFYRGSTYGLLISSCVLALCTLTKPNFTITIIPALAALGMHEFYSKGKIRYRHYTILMAPSLIILIRQFLVHSGNSDLYFVIAPLEVWDHYADGLLWPFFAAYLFPLTVIYAFWKSVYTDKLFLLIVLNLLFAILYTLLFAEMSRATGTFKHHGNFFWGIQAANQLLFVYLSLRLATAALPALSLKQMIPLAALGLQAISGVVWIHLIFLATAS